MKKALSATKMTLNRETLRLLESQELQPVWGGFTGPNSLCTSLLCVTKPRTACC